MMAMAAISALAETCHWTGAGGDGYWTNSANWAENRIPGRWLVADAEQLGGISTNGVTGEVAIFGDDLVAGGATTIDFDGVHSISNLITTGTSHRYTYGASSTQYVPIEPWGRFTVAELANTPVARLPAKLRAGVEVLAGTWDGTKWTNTYGSETVKVRNNSATEEFVFENTWGHCTRSSRHPTGGGQTGFQIEGLGSFRFSAQNQDNLPFFRNCLTTGKLVIDTKFAMRAFEINAPGEGLPADSTTVRQIEITENGAVASCEGQQPLLTANFPVHIFGDGYFAFTAGWVSSTYWHGYGIQLYADVTIDCMTKFRISANKTDANWAALANFPYRIVVYPGSGAKLRLNGPTTIGQEVVLNNWNTLPDPASSIAMRVIRYSAGVFCVTTFADDGPYGPSSFELTGNSAIQYVGDEAVTMTRGMVITNISGTAAARLDHQGTGTWTVTSPVTAAPNASTATLSLNGATAEAVFAGTIDAKTTVVCEGGNWTFAPSDGLCAKMAPKGGQLRMGTGVYTIKEIAPSANGSVMLVPDGCTLNVGKLVTAANKTMDFVFLGETAQVYIDPAAANALVGLKVNGHPAVLDAEGHPQMALGAANVWNRPENGSWTDATKWAGNQAVDPLKETFVDMIGADFAVTLDGVEQTITNLYVGSANGDSVRLILTNNAHLTVSGRTHVQSLLQMKKGACVEAYDSELELFNRGNLNGESALVSMLSLGGGSLAFHGASQLKDHGIPLSMRTSGSGNLNGALTFGTGRVDFYGDSTFATEYEEGHTTFYHYYRADKAGETSHVAFHDSSHFAFPNQPYQCFIGGNGGHAILVCESDSMDNLRMYYQLFAGVGTGVGDLILKGTGAYYMGVNFMQVGTPYATDKLTSSAAFATGRVDVAGSALCYVYANNTDVGGFGGLVVGQGLTLDKDRGASFLHGEITVREMGKLEQERGSFIVGGGPNGDGEVSLTGGTIKIVPQAYYENLVKGAVLVGGFGGNGRYTQTDGAFSTRRNVYVGGATTNEMYRYHNNGNRLQQYHDARGLVRVLGGSFTTLADIVLGRDGTGVLELSGTGTVAAATLVVSNTTGQAASTLRFTADAKGRCGKIDAATQVRFYPGSKLVVDVTACPEARRQVVALDLDSAVEGAEDVQVELVGDEGCRYPHRLAWSADRRRLAYSVDHGLMMYIR